jgi:hypothetical protein
MMTCFLYQEDSHADFPRCIAGIPWLYFNLYRLGDG